MSDAPAAVEKRQYRNQTAGWVGVVKLNSRGDEEGATCSPFGTLWLSDAEALLTARAPQDPKHNPFEEQVFFEIDPANPEGSRQERRIRPLVLVSEARYVPAEERYVPAEVLGGVHENAQVNAAASGDKPEVVVASPSSLPEKEAAIVASAPTVDVAVEEEAPPAPTPDVVVPTVVPPVEQTPGSGPAPDASATTGPPAPASTETAATPEVTTLDGEPAQSWVPEPAPPTTGALAGENASQGPSPVAETPTDAPAVAEPQEAPEVEETAAETESGEETGAAATPSGPAPEGEFAQHEEPGNPDAAAQSSS